MINHDMEDQIFLSIFTRVEKNINISSNLRSNSSYLHTETRHCRIPKMLWVERTSHRDETKRVEDEKHFLLNCPAYNLFRSKFQNICLTFLSF